jgi:uncharacterized Zn finger protein
MSRYFDNDWPRYVPATERRRRAARKIAKMKKAGHDASPVEIVGRKISETFWGDAWCKNLEAYSDYSNRLPRGRTYVRNGSVLDLQLEAGRVRALVSGTNLYTVDIKIKPLPKKTWDGIKGRCAGQIHSLVELLQGSISKGVMEIVTRKGEGLFPSPREITLNCSCPDWATMCKHVAATLYGVGVRLDLVPEVLFTLRGVDPTEMVEAAIDQPTGAGKTRKGRVLEVDELSSVFGVDIDMDGVSSGGKSRATQPPKRTRREVKSRKPAAPRVSQETEAKPTVTSRPAPLEKVAAKKKSTAKNTPSQKAAAKKRTAKNPNARKAVAKTFFNDTATTEKTTPRKKTTQKKSTTEKKVDPKKTSSRRKPAAKKAKK